MYKDKQDKGDYNTPLPLFRYLHESFQFELDPCDSGNNWLNLPFRFTKEDNGLSKEWDKNTFVNPPYGKETEEQWVNKCLEEFKKYRKNIFILLPNKTESTWFHRMFSAAEVVIFPQGRINFVQNGQKINGNIMGSVIFGLVDRNYHLESIRETPIHEFHNVNNSMEVFNLFLNRPLISSFIYFPSIKKINEKFG